MTKARKRLLLLILVAALGPAWGAERASPPVKPSVAAMGLSAVWDGAGRIELTWDRPREDRVSGFRVLRGTGPGEGLYPVGVIPASPRARQRFIDRVPGNTGYRFAYRVVALGDQERPLLLSERVEIAPPDQRPPARPVITAAAPTLGRTGLTWSPATDPDLAGYNVYRADGDGPAVRLNEKPLAEPRYDDVSVAGGRRYRYAVTAVDRWGNESGRSKAVTVRGLAEPDPAAVSAIKWRETPGGGDVLAWAPVASPDLRGYFVYLSNAPDGGFVNVSGLLQEPRYVEPAGIAGTRWYRVRAVYRGGVVSEPSEAVPGREEP